MVFSSAVFLFVYLPVVLGLTYAVPKRFRNTVLFVCSLIFYAWGEPVYVSLMLLSTVLDYVCGWGVDRFRGQRAAKGFLLGSVIGNLTLLGFFKYASPVSGALAPIFGLSALPEIALPIGISFYTFQTMSYTIDVYRGEAPVQKNIISLGAYVTLFPQLIAGPIVRYQTIAEQLNERSVDLARFGRGTRRFILGLGKKVLLANSVGALWDAVKVMDNPAALSAWLGIIAFAFQIYFDFSGYSDMAIGMGQMLGFDFLENFNYPYISRSVTEFWRRWHMSLGTWFRDYVYIPLGGNRRGAARTALNLAIVWLLTGIWHGAALNFVLWGVFFGVLILFERFIYKPNSRIYLLTAVLLGWVLFEYNDIAAGMGFFFALFGGNGWVDSFALYQLTNTGLLLVICAAASTPLWRRLLTPERLSRWDERQLPRLAATVFVMLVLALSTAYLVDSSYNPFLYFRF